MTRYPVEVVLRTADGCEHSRVSAEMHVDGLTACIMQLKTIPVPSVDLRGAEIILVTADGTDLMTWPVPTNAVLGDFLSIPSTLTLA